MSFKPYTEKIKKKKIGICSDPDPEPDPDPDPSSRKRIRRSGSASKWYGSETLVVDVVELCGASYPLDKGRFKSTTIWWQNIEENFGDP